MRSLCVFSYEPVVSVSLVHFFGVWLTHVNTGLFARKFHSSVPIMILFLDNGFGDPQLFSRICTNFTCTVLIKFEIKMTSKLLDGLWLNLSGTHIHVHIKMSTRTLVSKLRGLTRKTWMWHDLFDIRSPRTTYRHLAFSLLFRPQHANHHSFLSLDQKQKQWGNLMTSL